MANNREFLGRDLNEMRPAPAGTTVVKVIYKSIDGILDCYGKTMPADGSAGYAIGCTFRHVDGTDGSALYVNEGTATSSDFNLITVA